jgi:hypothetical protein
MSAEEYDGNVDAFLCWQLAIAELRKRGLRSGQYQPQDESERLIAEGGNV